MQREDMTTELKRQYTDELKKEIIAFANTEGGTIYIGVEDDGSVIGVEDVDDTMLRVGGTVRDAIRPDVTLFVTCRMVQMEGKPVVVVEVQRGTARPYYLGKKGIRPEGVFVRQGAASAPATEAAILAMIKETSGDSYEAARSLEQELTFQEAETQFAARDLPFGDAQKKTLKLIGEDGTYTNLALLLSEQCPQTMKLAVYEGGAKLVFRDRRELTGSILAQLKEAYDFIDRYNRVRAEFQGLDRVDIRDYPPEAIREALLNTMVHRDYGFRGSTLISIFDDRMEFVSLGGLAQGITYDDIMLGVSVLRNPNLANVFYRLQKIEAYGTGILKIQNSYAEYAVKPKIEVSDHGFKVTLPNVNAPRERSVGKHPALAYASEYDVLRDAGPGYVRPGRQFWQRPEDQMVVSEREQLVLRLVDTVGEVSRKDVQDVLAVSQATAILVLRDMTEKGLLVREGSGRFQRYRRR